MIAMKLTWLVLEALLLWCFAWFGSGVALALALELDFAQTQDLIGRAGYTLSRSSKFDLIIEYFILRKNYNVFEINEVLYDFDLPLLGC